MTRHVPAVEYESVAPVTEHPVAVPLEAMYDTPPVPLPPDVVKATDVGYVPAIEVTVRVAWFALLMVNV